MYSDIKHYQLYNKFQMLSIHKVNSINGLLSGRQVNNSINELTTTRKIDNSTNGLLTIR